MKIEELDDSTESIIETKFGHKSRVEEARLIAVRLDAKRALVGAGARILFYPTLLYNVFRNKIQPEFRWWDQIDQAHGIDHLVIPTRDYLFAPSFGDINKAVDFIHRNACNGQTTYVHCKAGRGRSTTIVLCYLVEYKHMSPVTALEYVRSRRPRVLLAPSQWKAVEEFQQQRMASKAICTSGDAVFITKVDLEGYRSPCNENSGKELMVSPRMARTRPMMAMLSCLFASLNVSGSTGTVVRQLTEARAC